MLNKTAIYPLILFAAISLACNLGAGEKREDVKTDEAASNSAEKNTAAETPNAETDSPAQTSLPKDRELDLQANHPNGTVLRVTKVSFKEDSTVLDFAVTNGYKYAIKLAQGGMQLRDNLGNQYNLSPPQANADIEVAPNSTIKGNLTFLGRVSPKADNLTLTTNYRYGNRTNEYDRTPTIVIDKIPAEN